MNVVLSDANMAENSNVTESEEPDSAAVETILTSETSISNAETSTSVAFTATMATTLSGLSHNTSTTNCSVSSSTASMIPRPVISGFGEIPATSRDQQQPNSNSFSGTSSTNDASSANTGFGSFSNNSGFGFGTFSSSSNTESSNAAPNNDSGGGFSGFGTSSGFGSSVATNTFNSNGFNSSAGFGFEASTGSQTFTRNSSASVNRNRNNRRSNNRGRYNNTSSNTSNFVVSSNATFSGDSANVNDIDDEDDDDGTLILMSSSRPDAPPNSRLFVICAKSLQKQQIKNFFISYGDVKQVFLIKDKQSKQSRGCAFVTFSSSYSALRALEAVNDFKPQLGNKLLKARLAQDPEKDDAKNKGSQTASITNEADEQKYLEKLSKLRISVQNSDTEESISSYFSTFGKIEFVNILRTRESQKSKGVAIVKFERASFAANAIENNKHKRFHPVIASGCNLSESAVPSAVSQSNQNSELSCNGTALSDEALQLNREEKMMAAAIWGLPQRDMAVRYDKSLTDVQIFKLLDIVPGLEDIKLDPNNSQNSDTKCCYPRFKTPLNAMYAREKLNGFEYPIGKFITVSFKSSFSTTNEGVMSLAIQNLATQPESADNGWPGCAGSIGQNDFNAGFGTSGSAQSGANLDQGFFVAQNQMTNGFSSNLNGE